MKYTLLLRLVAPMQSWGVQSRFEIRDTVTEPTKSGVIGLICAALGRDRTEPIEDLAKLRMGVRIDREGIMRKEYQTALKVIQASSKNDNTGLKDCQPSTRYYLADAAFLVGLEGEDKNLLKTIDVALQNPRWFLFLGRKSFVPSEPIFLPRGKKVNPPYLIEQSLEDALLSYPAITKHFIQYDTKKRIRFVIECDESIPDSALAIITRPDNPISFEPRNFGLRTVAVIDCAAAECFTWNSTIGVTKSKETHHV